MKMNQIRTYLAGFALVFLSSTFVFSQETSGEVFEYEAGGLEQYMGEGANVGGFIFPSLYFIGTGGVFEPAANPGNFASSEHDPLNEFGIQAIEAHIGLQFGENVSGLISGFGYQGEKEWEAELEEAFLHFQVNDFITIGGGQFLNQFGFQGGTHLHDWFFVNQNLVNARTLNEGELITQGGEIIFNTPQNSGRLTLGAGGVRTHSHAHEHGEPEGEDGDEEHHLEADGAGFNNSVFTADYRFRLPFDDSITAALSVATGENGFGENTQAFGVGVQKVWNGRDHGHGGPDFCTGATMFRTEFIGRDVEGFTEDGDTVSFDDQGLSSSIHYGLTDVTTLSLRHDWVSGVEMAELDERHRISPAISTHFGPGDRIRARLQYDYTHSDTDAIGSEHAAWFQIQIQWGGQGGSHAGHNH